MKRFNEINLTTTFEDKFSNGVNKIVITANPSEYLKSFKIVFAMFPENKGLKLCANWFVETISSIEDHWNFIDSDLTIAIPEKHRITMGSVWTHMILFHSNVSVFCEKCNESIYSIHLKMNPWHFLIEETDTFMYGKQFVCPEGHVLFKNEEWKMHHNEK